MCVVIICVCHIVCVCHTVCSNVVDGNGACVWVCGHVCVPVVVSYPLNGPFHLDDCS